MRNLYDDEFGGLQRFNSLVFKKLFDEAWEASDKKLEEFCSEFAESIGLSGESIERIKSWRKGKAAPEDLDLVMAIVKTLGCSAKDLLIPVYVDAKQHKIEKEHDQLIINRLREMVKQPNGTWYGNSLFRFTEMMDYYAIKMDGYSNLYDIIIGEGYDSENEQELKGNYAERIGNIICYQNDPSLSELLGYHCKYSEEEIKNIINRMPADADDSYFMNLFSSNLVDSDGKRMVDSNGNYVFSFKEFCTKLINTPIPFDEEERNELKETVSELQKNFDKCDCRWSLLEIEIAFKDKVIKTFTYGMGWSKPTHTDRWELIKEIMSFFDSRIDRLCLCNATEVIIDQFESEAHFKFDLAKY